MTNGRMRNGRMRNGSMTSVTHLAGLEIVSLNATLGFPVTQGQLYSDFSLYRTRRTTHVLLLLGQQRQATHLSIHFQMELAHAGHDGLGGRQ